MEKFLTYIIVPLAMGCMFFVFLTREHAVQGEQTLIPDQRPEMTMIQNDENQSIIPENPMQDIPLKNMYDRVILKSFGMMITPKNSPVSPERFHGYHTGVDLEIFEDEKSMEVPVYAVCDGAMIVKERVGGYGGVVVQECIVHDMKVRVIYGHISLRSVKSDVGVQIMRGELIGILGSGYSEETDFERKHLHLSFYAQDQRDMRGYVQDQNELSQWVDPCEQVILCELKKSE